ncbi:hypothetical protein ACEPAG_3723 [Sanghuangporus baumii]
MLSSILFFVFSLFSAASVNASLYPTRPIANTVFRGGSYNNISWIDNDAVPGFSLAQLGELEIDLWVDEIVFTDIESTSQKRLAILATGVDPQQKFQSVYISPLLWDNASNFVIRFKSLKPPETIYTADFSMINMTGNRTAHLDKNLHQSLTNSAALTVSSSSSSAGSSSVPDVGYNDLVTVTKEMSNSNTVSFPEPTSADAVAAMVNSASNGVRHGRRPSMQFNFVFVLFPALFGLALAL